MIGDRGLRTADWKTVKLGAVASVERSSIQPEEIRSCTIYVGLEHIESGGRFLDPMPVEPGALESSKFRFGPEHVLYGKLRPYLAKIACPDFAGVCSTDIVPLRPTACVNRRYLYHYLRQPSMVDYANSRAVGVNLPRLSPNALEDFDLPLPPLAEQRRIAEVLDRAEASRAKRRAALAQLDSLTQSLFLDLFGDPVLNARHWPHVHLSDVISMPLRNGLSPSKSGRVTAKVLTLSAITGSSFDACAWKESTFITRPPEDQSVNISDFLICRGNGNVRLVGRAFFPPASTPDVTFPDTMIAARIAPERIERSFLQHIWNSSAVRTQIESSARTTNGTFKVNQEILEKIAFVAPPLPLQQTFARRVAAVERLKASHRAALAQLDALFASLQHRAFRGEL